MKTINTIFILILVCFMVFVVIGFIKDKSWLIEETMEINAPKEIVYSAFSKWENWNNWSPWFEKDSTLTTRVEGIDGHVESVFRWKGVDEITGSGSLTNIGFIENKKLVYYIKYTAPMQIGWNGAIEIQNKKGKTEVTWTNSGELSFLDRAMSVFFDMDAQVRPDMQRGLQLLKEYCEYMAFNNKSTSFIDWSKETYVETSYITIRSEIPWMYVKEQSFLEQEFSKLKQYINENNISKTGEPSLLYFSLDTIKEKTDVAFAIPVSKETVGNDTFKILILGTSPASTVRYYTDNIGVDEIYDNFKNYFGVKGLIFKYPVIAWYVSDEKLKHDSIKWNTKITYLHD